MLERAEELVMEGARLGMRHTNLAGPVLSYILYLVKLLNSCSYISCNNQTKLKVWFKRYETAGELDDHWRPPPDPGSTLGPNQEMSHDGW